jgi:hypothetical protein
MKHYVIRSVEDLFAVPVKKRPHMLRDLANWLEVHDMAAKHFDRIPGIEFVRDTFEWIDDGKHDVHFMPEIVNKARQP